MDEVAVKSQEKKIAELVQELAQANAVALRWYRAASPYATPEALKEALSVPAPKTVTALKEERDRAEKAYVAACGIPENKPPKVGAEELDVLRQALFAADARYRTALNG